MANQQSKPQKLSPRRSISDDVELYRTLLRLDAPEAAALCASITTRLYNEPVTETDVESIWALQSPELISAVLYNIAKSDVLNMRPTGGYIQLFIETEMLGYGDRGAARIVNMYEGHREKLRGEAHVRPFRGVCRILNRVFCGILGISKRSI